MAVAVMGAAIPEMGYACLTNLGGCVETFLIGAEIGAGIGTGAVFPSPLNPGVTGKPAGVLSKADGVVDAAAVKIASAGRNAGKEGGLTFLFQTTLITSLRLALLGKLRREKMLNPIPLKILILYYTIHQI